MMFGALFDFGNRLWAEAAIIHLKRQGFLESIKEYGREHRSPVFYVGAKSFGTKEYAAGVGVSKKYGAALTSAVMEFVERYVLAEENGRPVFPAASGGNGVSRFRRVEGFSWPDERKVFLPAQTIFWNYGVKASGETLFVEPGISGAAAAPRKNEAIAFGIYELIERDAFLLHWLKKITPPRIVPESVGDSEIRFLLNEAAKRGLKVHILDITSDIPAPAYIVALAQDKPPLVSRGSSSNLNPVSAVKKAFYEAWGNYILNLHLLQNGGLDAEQERETAAARQILKRYALWTKPSSFAHFEFLLKGEERRFIPGPHYTTEEALEKLKEVFENQEVCYYKAQHPVLEALGVCVVKVIIPGLIPFYFQEENARFAFEHPRLQGQICNTFPHPFA